MDVTLPSKDAQRGGAGAFACQLLSRDRRLRPRSSISPWRGEGYLSPAVSDAVLDDYRRHVTNPIDLLTSREREVLQMLAEGKTNKEIAGVLNLSVYTVDAHRGRIMEKLNVHSINELVRFAVRNGLID